MKNLKSPLFALAGIILVLLATVKHSVMVYIEITETPREWYHFAYLALMILAIDTAVIIFSLHGHKGASNLFAWLIGVINLYFFWSPKTFPDFTFTGLVPFLPGLIYSALFTAGLSMFTDIFISQIEQEDEISGLYSQLETSRKETSAIQTELESIRKTVSTKSTEEGKLLEAALDLLITQGAVGDKNQETVKRNLRNAKAKQKEPGIRPEDLLQAKVREALYTRALNGHAGT